MLLKLKRFFLQELFKETWSEALKCNDDYKVNCKVLDLLAGSHSTQVSPTVNIHPLFELLLFTDLIKEVDDLSIFFFTTATSFLSRSHDNLLCHDNCLY